MTLARATAILGLIALFLETWGVYRVVSCVVTLRSREFAVRVALGSRPNTVLRMVLSDAMTTAALGATVGAAAAIAIGRVIQSEARAPGRSEPGRNRPARGRADCSDARRVRDPGREGWKSESVAVAEGELTAPTLLSYALVPEQARLLRVTLTCPVTRPG